MAEIGVSALIDTGANINFIDDDLAKALDLPIVDTQPVSGSSGKHEVNMYLAQIHIPDVPATIFEKFGGIALAAGGQSHRALLGRAFLSGFHLNYDGRTGSVELTA